MERMTETADDGINIIRCTNDRYVGVSYIGYPDGVYFGNVIDRLAAYEDTELTPEEINDTLSRFSKFLMKMTGNRMSKTNYTLDAMTSVALDYQEEVCNECEYKNGWISVENRLPSGNGDYLVVKTLRGSRTPSIDVLSFAQDLHKLGYIDFSEPQYKGRTGWYDYDSDIGYYDVDGVTHWQPLPDLPEE